jgi:hypothetical protein
MWAEVPSLAPYPAVLLNRFDAGGDDGTVWVLVAFGATLIIALEDD